MKDLFAVMGQERRPWLDAEQVKARFLELAAEWHPDRLTGMDTAGRSAAQERYTELNRACQVLGSPKDRLRHLVELETGKQVIDLQEISPELVGFFMETLQDIRESGRFLQEKAKVTSPLLRVQQFAASQQWVERLQQRQGTLEAREAELLEQVRALDSAWQQGERGPGLLQRAEDLYRTLGFIARWRAQMQESIVRLTL